MTAIDEMALENAIQNVTAYIWKDEHGSSRDAWIVVYRPMLTVFANSLLAAQPSGWRPISEAPKDGTPIVVGHMVRYLPYKKGSGMEGKGRWQEHNGYGWQNIDWEPTEWQPPAQGEV